MALVFSLFLLFVLHASRVDAEITILALSQQRYVKSHRNFDNINIIKKLARYRIPKFYLLLGQNFGSFKFP